MRSLAAALRARWQRLLVREDGPTSTEYAVMLALMIVVMIAAITAVGGKVNALYASTVNGW